MICSAVILAPEPAKDAINAASMASNPIASSARRRSLPPPTSSENEVAATWTAPGDKGGGDEGGGQGASSERNRPATPADDPRSPNIVDASEASNTEDPAPLSGPSETPLKREKANSVAYGEAISYIVALPSIAPSAMALVMNSPSCG